MIKTIWSAKASEFDDMVNDSIKEGWKLKVRGTRELVGVGGFYAELDKPDEVDATGIGEALRTIKTVCADRESCNDCPIEAYLGACPCDANEPASWMLDD